MLPVLAVAVAAGCAATPQPPALELTAIVDSLEQQEDKFEDGLEAVLRAAPQGGRFEVLVDLTRQVSYPELYRQLQGDRRSRAARRREVVSILERIAAEQQSRLQPTIEQWIDRGLLDHVQPVAIVNRLIVEGSAPGILQLAERPEVARVLHEWRSGRDRAGQQQHRLATGGPTLGESFTSWAIEAMGVHRLWERGLDGSGVVVAAIDSGVYEDHEQLRGRRLEGDRGWLDPVQGLAEPYDNHGHGTTVLSQAVGGNPDHRTVGVAPGAHWAMALGNWHNRYSRIRMTLAADWILRVARPDVVINAWSDNEGACADFDLAFINAWKAAGIFVVFPAGNAGPDPRTGEAPAQLAGSFPDGAPVFSVAGLAPTGEVHAESSRGPSACGSEEFPSLAAPGAGLPLATPTLPSGYAIGDGTSLAAGLAGGAAALLLQADPELDPWALERILIETARDVPPGGRDDASGAGALYLPAALERVLEHRAARERGSR